MGDMMEILTNGQFPATKHRVVIPKEEALRRQPRQSFVFFVNPEDEVKLEPVCCLERPDEKTEKYRNVKVNAWQYQKAKFDQTY